MTTHDNIHIPTESWPHWIWFAIEFFIVLAVSMLVSRQIMGAFSFEENDPIQHWIFYSFVGGIFFGWYIVIRTWILKKPILN